MRNELVSRTEHERNEVKTGKAMAISLHPRFLRFSPIADASDLSLLWLCSNKAHGIRHIRHQNAIQAVTTQQHGGAFPTFRLFRARAAACAAARLVPPALAILVLLAAAPLLIIRAIVVPVCMAGVCATGTAVRKAAGIVWAHTAVA